jgi:hypothetical protein
VCVLFRYIAELVSPNLTEGFINDKKAFTVVDLIEWS